MSLRVGTSIAPGNGPPPMRRALPLLALALAGCLAPPPFGPAAPGLAFEVQELPGPWLGAEPNLATGPDGNVWVVAVGSVLTRPNIARSELNLWHSADSGATWETQREPATQDASKQGAWCSCDTDVEYGADGTLYLTDFWVGPGVNGFVVEASADDGATWRTGNFATITRPVANDRQYLAVGPGPGEVYLAYARGSAAGLLPVALPAQDPEAGLHLWASADGGQTFQPRTMPYVGSDMFIAKPRVDAEGTIYYPFVQETDWDTPGTVMVAVSRDAGNTWDLREAGSIPNGVGGLWPLEADVGPDGMLHLVWMERGPEGVGSQLWYTRSTDGAETFAAPVRVGWTRGTALLPWIAHAGPGRAVVAFYGNDTALVPLEAAEDTRWYAWAFVVDGTSLTATAPVQVAPWPVKVGTFCPQGAVCPEDRELLDYPAVIWRDGWVNVAFAVSTLDEGTGPPRSASDEEPRGGHSTAAKVWVGRARLD